MRNRVVSMAVSSSSHSSRSLAPHAMKGTADEVESRAAHLPGKCCGYQPGARMIARRCSSCATCKAKAPSARSHLVMSFACSCMSDRCSTIEELEKIG